MASEPNKADATTEPDRQPEAVEQDAAGELAVPSKADVRAALDHVSQSVHAFTYDGDRTPTHESGAPERRGLVLGDDDPRDAALHERIDAERVVYEGLIFNVNRVDVTLPDGRRAERDVIRHPGAVAVVALTDDGRICLVRQYRTALDRVTVEIPAGKLDPGEDPLEAARRELAEETGFEAGRIAYLTTIATTLGFCDELIHIYMATELRAGASHPDADEFLGVDLVDVGDLVDAVLDGKIEDAKTVVGALACDAIARRLETDGG